MSPDLRRNIADENGVSYFVYDTERDRQVAGPFGSRSYAHTVRKRCNWPWPDDLSVLTERRLVQHRVA